MVNSYSTFYTITTPENEWFLLSLVAVDSAMGVLSTQVYKNLTDFWWFIFFAEDFTVVNNCSITATCSRSLPLITTC